MAHLGKMKDIYKVCNLYPGPLGSDNPSNDRRHLTSQGWAHFFVERHRTVPWSHGWQCEVTHRNTGLSPSGWWFGTFFIFPDIGNVIIPID